MSAPRPDLRLRLIAVAGGRAARHGRPTENWEHVMPCGMRTSERRRPVAAGGSR